MFNFIYITIILSTDSILKLDKNYQYKYKYIIN